MNDDCEEDFIQELDSESFPRHTVNTLNVIQLVELNAIENLVCDKNSDFESFTVKQDKPFDLTEEKYGNWEIVGYC